MVNALREELDKSLVVAKIASTKKYGRREGYTQEIEAFIYNLDVIISVGYRVKSTRGVAFRQWLECGEFNRRNTANHKEPIGATVKIRNL